MDSNPRSEFYDSISHYIKNAHAAVRNCNFNKNLSIEPIHVVLGNQSADIDSIASTIALAFYYSTNKKELFLPVINIPRQELELRKDVLHVLTTLKIDLDSLFYQDDLPYFLDLAKQGNVRLTLVDHNLLVPDQEGFGSYVERIIDHHSDERSKYPLITEKVIETVGSNSTLIGNIVLASTENCSPEIAYLLLAAILLDTGNLKNAPVVTDKDNNIAEILIKKAGKYYDDKFFDHLMKLRHDVDNLSSDLLLKKDFKLYKEGQCFYGIASIPKGVVWSAENREQWKKAFADALKTQRVCMLCALVFKEGADLGVNDRIFIVYIPIIKYQKTFLNHVRETEGLKNELIVKEYFPDEGLIFFDLKTSLKRKQLQPLLQLSSCNFAYDTT